MEEPSPSKWPTADYTQSASATQHPRFGLRLSCVSVDDYILHPLFFRQVVSRKQVIDWRISLQRKGRQDQRQSMRRPSDRFSIREAPHRPKSRRLKAAVIDLSLICLFARHAATNSVMLILPVPSTSIASKIHSTCRMGQRGVDSRCRSSNYRQRSGRGQAFSM